jgi:hypothetical protein
LDPKYRLFIISVGVSLPNAIGAIRSSTDKHLTIHVELHSLHLTLFLMTSKGHLLLSTRIIEKHNQRIIRPHSNDVPRTVDAKAMG